MPSRELHNKTRQDMNRNFQIYGSGIAVFFCALSDICYADTVTIDGYTYTFHSDAVGIRLQNCISENWDNNTEESTPAISPLPSGDFILPDNINGTNFWHIGANAFRGCTNLTSITIPDGPSLFGVSVGASLGESCFEGCTSLTNIVFRSSTAVIYSRAFASCTALQKFEFPEDVRFISEGFFSNCTSLVSVQIPERCTRIENNAFWGCAKLSKINIPNQVQYIHSGAFSGAFENSDLPNGLVFVGKWLLGCKGRDSRQLIIPEGNWKIPSMRLKSDDNSYWEMPFFYSDNLKHHAPCELVINGGFDHDSELQMDFPILSDGITSITIGHKIRHLGGFGLGTSNRLESLTILGNVPSYRLRSYSDYSNLTLHGNPYSMTPFNMIGAFSTNTLDRLYRQNPRSVKNLCIRIFYDTLTDNVNDALEQTTVLAEVLSSPSYVKDPTDIEYICQALESSMSYVRPDSFYGKKRVDSTYRLLLGKIQKQNATISLYLYHTYDHPSGAFAVAADYESRNDKLRAVQYYQKAANGYANGLCLLTENKNVALGLTIDSTEDVILNCIRAIDDLGYQEIAERTLLSTQEIRERVNAVPLQTTEKISYGTGWACNTNYIVTCWHVVKDYDVISGILKDGQKIDLSLYAKDELSDIAILKINDEAVALAALPIASIPAKSSDKVFTIGYPLSHLLGSEQKFTDGSISAASGLFDDRRFYQISVPLQPGNSGGPLLSQTGAVIGITAAGLDAIATLATEGTIPQNVNYAIKVRYLQNLLDDIGVNFTLKEKPISDFSQIVESTSQSVLVICAKDIVHQ